MIQITVLNDNRCFDNTLKCEHGISLFLDIFGTKILFDLGQTDIFLSNAKKLNIDLSATNYIVLSHGHYDHTGGLSFLNLPTKPKLICHPFADEYRVSKTTGNYAGMNEKLTILSKNYDVITSKEPYNIADNIWFLGEIPRIFDYECKSFPMLNKYGKDDIANDDSGIVINTQKGIVVISGCAHSGICNTIEYAKKVANNNKVFAVLGGFHLKTIDNQTIQTANYLKNIPNVYLAHCTSDEVIEYFRQTLKQSKVLSTGNSYVL